MRLPAIYFRHVAREVGAQTLIVLLVLLAVLAIYQFSFVLGRAADGQIDGATVMRLAWLTLRTNIGVILPFAVLLGVVMGLGRLYWDSEITAAEASGAGRGVLYAAAASVVLPAAALAAWISFIDGPAAAREAVELRLAALRTQVTRGLAPGSFRSVGEGVTLHFESRDADGGLRGVFLQRDLESPGNAPARMQVVLARRAHYHIDETAGAIDVELRDGYSYEGSPQGLDWQVMQFDRQLLRLPVPQARLPGPPRTDQLPNRLLLASNDPRQLAELHWRIGWVAAVLVLGFLAVPLGRLDPRQGRYARVPSAVLLFGVAAGLLVSGRTLLERGDMPAPLGLWWVHALVLACAALLLGWPKLAARLRRRATS
jgi:lipopolysaccharide export system permease protein